MRTHLEQPSTLSAQAQLPSSSAAPGATGSGNSSGTDKLQKYASEFESMLLSSLWKTQQEDDEENDDELGGTSGPLQDVAFQVLAGQAVKSKGFGIAQMIIRSLEGPKDTTSHGPSGLQNFISHADKIDVTSPSGGQAAGNGSANQPQKPDPLIKGF